VGSRLGSRTPVRGGRARRFYRLQPKGLRALNNARAAIDSLWRGFNWPLKNSYESNTTSNRRYQRFWA
jgi:DNA-binding PadR family transcriptional regulator